LGAAGGARGHVGPDAGGRALLIDLADINGRIELEGEVCVVGAGAAGISLTRRLLAAGHNVVLLESGGIDYEAPVAALNHGDCVGETNYPLEHARPRFFGGTAAIWGGRCAELDPIDLERRDYVPYSGWPIAWEELRGWYDEARRLFGLPPRPPHAGDLRAEQAPNSESRVRLNGEADALGVPRVALDWRLSELDIRSVVVLLAAVDRELKRLGLGEVEPATWLGLGRWETDPLISAHPIGGYHHMGTTRMGTDRACSVTDAEGRVHGLGNLWIAGSSLFPTGSWANPTLTAVALALRTANRITAELGR
jgi:choline dehydrogenase-like flavoprotein